MGRQWGSDRGLKSRAQIPPQNVIERFAAVLPVLTVPWWVVLQWPERRGHRQPGLRWMTLLEVKLHFDWLLPASDSRFSQRGEPTQDTAAAGGFFVTLGHAQ